MATSASSTDVADDGALATTLTTPLASASEPVTVVGSAAASSASSSVGATPNSTGSATGTASPAAHAPTPAGVHKKNLEDVVELKRRRLAAQLRQINRAETALFAKYARFTDSHLGVINQAATDVLQRVGLHFRPWTRLEHSRFLLGLRLFEAFEKPQQWRRIARFVITRNAEEVELHWRIHSLFAEDSELLASCITPPDSTHAARSSPSDNKSPTPSPSASAGKSHHHHDDAASAATSTTTTTTTTAATAAAALNANSSLSSSLQYHDSLTQTPALELSSSVDLDVHIYTAFDVAIVYNSPHGQHYRERVGALHVAGPVSGTGRPLGHRFPPWSTEELTMLRAALAKHGSAPGAGESAFSFLLRVAAEVPTKSVRDLALVYFSGGRVEISDKPTARKRRLSARSGDSDSSKRPRVARSRSKPSSRFTSQQNLIHINALLNSNASLLQRIKSAPDANTAANHMAQFCINFNNAYSLITQIHALPPLPVKLNTHMAAMHLQQSAALAGRPIGLAVPAASVPVATFQPATPTPPPPPPPGTAALFATPYQHHLQYQQALASISAPALLLPTETPQQQS